MAERVDYYSDAEYQQALSWEELSTYREEPPICPCFKCGGTMYQKSIHEEDNICKDCALIKGLKND